MPTLFLNDAEFYYADEGKGLALLLIHGSFSRGDTAFSGLLPLLSAQYRVICPDLRGHGRTRCASLMWTEPQLAQDMLDLLDALHLERVHIIGHSMGGDVAMSCAVMAPERCLSLISIGSAGSPNPALAHYLAKLDDPAKAKRWRSSPLVAQIKERHLAAHKGNWQAFFRTTIRSCMRYPVFSETDLARISMPFLLVHGENDAYVSPEECARLSACCPGFCRKVIVGAGHSPQNEQAGLLELKDMLLSFLAQAEQGLLPG